MKKIKAYLELRKDRYGIWLLFKPIEGSEATLVNLETLLGPINVGSEVIRQWAEEQFPKPVKRIKKASEIIKWCEDNGWEFQLDCWTSPANEAPKGNGVLYCRMLRDCGKLVRDSEFIWGNAEWVEEVDV